MILLTFCFDLFLSGEKELNNAKGAERRLEDLASGQFPIGMYIYVYIYIYNSQGSLKALLRLS